MNKQKYKTEDQVFRELFKSSFKPDMIADKDFNRKVMDRVMSDWVSQPNYYKPLVGPKKKWWIVPAVALILLSGYLFDIARLGSNANEALWLRDMGTAFQSLYSWIEPIHIIIFGVSGAIGLLLMMDRFFQKLSNA